jgi:hypothetical protein
MEGLRDFSEIYTTAVQTESELVAKAPLFVESVFGGGSNVNFDVIFFNPCLNQASRLPIAHFSTLAHKAVSIWHARLENATDTSVCTNPRSLRWPNTARN